MRKFGLIGKSLKHSFSQKYFTEKFEKESIDARYDLIEIDNILELHKNIDIEQFEGLNVTIPFKQEITSILDEISPEAEAIGAVNTVKNIGGKLVGYNTDTYGFRNSLKPFLKKYHRKALILGTGGASKAIAYVLDQLGLDYLFVSRNPNGSNQVSYEELNENAVSFFPLIINCTPLGTYPDVDECPAIPYSFLDEKNFLYDLVYNPEESLFLLKGKAQGTQILNGRSMLHFQAEKAWEIWNSSI